MTGPEHYREAERLIAEWREVKAGGEGWPPPPITPVQLTEAVAHGLLALAAAAALAPAGRSVNDRVYAAWEKAGS